MLEILKHCVYTSGLQTVFVKAKKIYALGNYSDFSKCKIISEILKLLIKIF